MTSHEEKRVIKNFIARYIDGEIRWIDIDIRIFVKKFEQIWLFGLTIIPIAAALVFKTRDAKL